jgi:hypothetical protein
VATVPLSIQQVGVGVPLGVGVPPGVALAVGVGAGDGDVGVAVGVGANGAMRNAEGAGGSSYCSSGSVGSGLGCAAWREAMAKTGGSTRKITATRADRITKRQTFFMQ